MNLRLLQSLGYVYKEVVHSGRLTLVVASLPWAVRYGKLQYQMEPCLRDKWTSSRYWWGVGAVLSQRGGCRDTKGLVDLRAFHQQHYI